MDKQLKLEKELAQIKDTVLNFTQL